MRAQIDDQLIEPKAYARILAKRHTDPSFILSMVKMEYGPHHDLTLDYIKGLIKREPSRASNVVYLPVKQAKPIQVRPKFETPQTWRDIVDLVAWRYKVDPNEIIGHCRAQAYFTPRRMVIYILHKRGNSLCQIGRWLDGRHHTSIMSAYRKFLERASHDEVLFADRYIPKG